MNTLPIGRYRFFQTLQPVSLLTKIASESFSGCLQVFSTSASWSFYFNEGKLIYACAVEKNFDILYRNLRQFSQQIPTIHNAVYKQLQVIFETSIENQAIPNPDYLAICWLVNQNYLTSAQAGILVEQIALEVIESFLRLREGSYEFVPESFLDDMPKFCELDIFLLIESCKKRRNQENIKSQATQQQQTRQFQTKIGQTFVKQNGVLPPRINTHSNTRQQVYQQNIAKKTYTVFCVDDTPLVLNNIKKCLDEQIFSFVGVNNPVKALIQVLRSKPDLIFLDADMDKLSGYELCSLLRKHSCFQNIPVILLTEKIGLIHRFKAKLVGASGYLAKPFTPADLLKVIFKHIQ
jgi:CheY-like chemotaxis protein